jgi:SNF2 family DNA or RNA helicase
MSNSNDLLDLFLRINEDGRSSSPATTRLDSSATFDFLTLYDLYQLRSISKRTFSALKTVEYTRCRDGCDYAVPFPAYPGILCTESDRKLGAGLFRHQLASLAAMHKAENNHVSFGSLRGGILGDAPGLGKTITMLSLIVNTAGLRPVEPEEFYDNQSIAEHWKLMRVNPVFRTEILKSIKPLRGASNYDELARYVSPPFLDDDRFPTLSSFERHVNRQMANKVPRAQLDLFRRNVILFKAGLDKRNRRFFSNDKGRRMVFERNLVPCSTTLIIVPDALLEHWAEQIRCHVKLDVFGETRGSGDGVVYIDGVGDLSRARFPLNHRPMALPSMFDLVNYLMVVVPFSRIKQQHYLRKRRRKEDVDDLAEDDNGSESSPLLQLRWFRIVVDEGHELGENEAGNDITAYINTLAAERRWVMSGTPTTGDEDSVEFNDIGLTQLQRLLLFLRHEKYGTTKNQSPEKKSNRGGGGGSGRRHDNAMAKSEWDKMVRIPFLKKQHAGREELFRVLKEVMVMHKKEDIGLPKPVFKQGEVTVQIPQEVGSHIVNAVQTNAFSLEIDDRSL